MFEDYVFLVDFAKTGDFSYLLTNYEEVKLPD